MSPRRVPTYARFITGELRRFAAFQLVSGCVTDIGGTCCHAAIVAREYGIAAVAGTGYGTKMIQTGDRIRVDGDTGVVQILERASG